MAKNPAAVSPPAPSSARRHEVDTERRRQHPGEPRKTVSADRPTPRDDRRGAHAYAGPQRSR